MKILGWDKLNGTKIISFFCCLIIVLFNGITRSKVRIAHRPGKLGERCYNDGNELLEIFLIHGRRINASVFMEVFVTNLSMAR